MEVTAKETIIFKGEIRREGEKFECEESKIAFLQARGLIEPVEMSLPSLEEEIRRKKR